MSAHNETLLSRVVKEFQVQITMIHEENRLATFKKWVFPNTATCNAQKMAEAGFYSVATAGEPDLVQCFLCCKALDGWEETDDPWLEHLKHNKQCSFATLHKPEEELTLSEYADMQQDMLLNIIDKYYADALAKYEYDADCYLECLDEFVEDEEA